MLSKDMESKVRKALGRYSEWQVANMYGLRVAVVRAIKMEMETDNLSTRRQQDLFEHLFDHKTATGRKQETPLEVGLRIHADLYKSHGEGQPLNLLHQDYAGLEARVLSGFFTPNGTPTPAFWGFVSQYVKKSGHVMLDILHDQEIYSPEQLTEALDFDKQIEKLNDPQAILLARRLLKKVYGNYVTDSDSADPGSDVPNSQ